MTKETIDICPNHTDRPVAMISTMAFPGAELWCPSCGHTCGWPFGDTKEIPVTDELKEQTLAWKKRSKGFLNAKASFSCSSLLWKGKRISPNELPDKEKKRLKTIIDNWKYEIEL